MDLGLYIRLQPHYIRLQPLHIPLQPPPRAVTASTTCGYSLHRVRSQPPPRTATGTLYDRDPAEGGAAVLRRGEWREGVPYEPDPPQQRQKRPRDFRVGGALSLTSTSTSTSRGCKRSAPAARYVLGVAENATPALLAAELGTTANEVGR